MYMSAAMKLNERILYHVMVKKHHVTRIVLTDAEIAAVRDSAPPEHVWFGMNGRLYFNRIPVYSVDRV